MAVKEDKPEPSKAFVPDVLEADPAREPGFYVGDNGPYLTEADAQAFIDGHLDGKGSVEEVTAND